MKEVKNTFEELFSEVIEESQNIIIEYHDGNFTYEDQDYITFKVDRVNECSTSDQFKHKVLKMIRVSIRKLKNHINNIPEEERIDFLHSIKNRLSELSCVVGDEVVIEEASEYGPREELHYKTFVNPSFNGTIDELIDSYKKSINRKAEDYAEKWIEAIGEAKQILDFLINQEDFFSEATKDAISIPYVDQSRIEQLRNIKSEDYDLTRLIAQCEELNDASNRGNSYSVILLVRAIIDHIPPIFGKKNFKEVANNYGSKSFKESMDRLENSSRKIADSSIHQQIRRKESLPNKTLVNFSNDLDVLLAEVVRILK